ncbi:complement C1q-like protein 2 [Astyanax mexicanus]|uniref:Complement C1q-like protein 2 n=1 Tax=Astyanax mexicanus TaxID=7994 RepID=A0A3B1K861_ASTMX|nr:complement C1q-like protein 2 [Astyanax mexicanus]
MSPVYLLVLVLGCSLLEGQSVRVNGISHNDDRENEIQAEHPTTQATTTTSTQQIYLSDIHAVLREMSAVLAELKFDQRHTMIAVNNLESRLRASESKVEELKKKVEEESHINQGKKVAFSAALLASGSGNTGPYSTDITLVYKHIFTNIGNAYNPNTGIFTAPSRGVYAFRFDIHGGAGRTVGVNLYKKGQFVAGTHTIQDKGSVSSSKGVSLLLEVGDDVYIKLPAGKWLYDSGLHHSTFSGQMLFYV